MMKYRSACAIVIFITMHLLSGCMIVDGLAGNIHSPHQTFLIFYGGYVGKPVRELSYGWPQPISVKQLPNGSIEREYWLRKGACRFFYEYDPNTEIIIRWRYEGGEENCVKPPYT